MRQLLLVALLSAIAASAITFVLCDALREPQPAPAAPPGLTAPELKAALADLVREAASARRAAAEAREMRATSAEPAAAPRSGRAATAHDESAPAPDAAPVVRRGLPPELPQAAATTAERFRHALPVHDDTTHDDDARARELRRWMFRSERDVFEWFGQPDSVNPEGETETWFYNVATGETGDDGTPKRRTYWIRLNKGRLIEIGD